MTRRLFFINFVVLSFLNGLILDIPLGHISWHNEKLDGYDRIVLSESSILPYDPGAPEIPAIVLNYLIPKDQTVKEIKILSEDWQEYPGHFRVLPKQEELSLESAYVFTEPDLEIYNSSLPFPAKSVISYNCGNLRGYRILQITIAPLRYLPRQHKIDYLKRLTCEVITENRPPGVAPVRETHLSKRLLDKFLGKLAVNHASKDHSSFCPTSYIQDNPNDSLPTDVPSLQGPPVDLVIITNYEQEPSYDILARLKKLSGINTVVRTISWVREHYAGMDDAEKIRNFIKDAYEKWGISFVLLGGDTPIIPTRFVWVDRTKIYTSLWLPIASDLYYSDLDGNWNYDGDEKFGEMEDSLDLYPDVFIGRIPTTSESEVSDYFDKLHAYIFPVNNSVQTKALFFSSYLDYNWPGLPYAYELADHLPEHFAKSFLDETLNNLSLESLQDSIHSGFGIICGVGHGDVSNICIKFIPPRVYAQNFYFDSLSNEHLYSLMVVITCYTNPFQADCVGEHWVLNPHGGGIAYIGPTSSSEGGIHRDYMKVLFDSLFVSTIGQSLAFAKVPFVGSSQADNWHRVHQFSISLLGDPTLVLWDTLPMNFNSITVQPDTVYVGYDTVTITGDPTVPFNVIFYKEGETYIWDSTGTGVLQTCVKTESPGFLKYTVMCDGYISYVDSIFVESGQAYLVYKGHTIVDSLHTMDGVINPGEFINVYLTLKNSGDSMASGVHARLACADDMMKMMNDTASFADIGPGESGVNVTPFRFHVSELMPDEHSFDFEIAITYSSGASSDSFQLVGFAPLLVHFTQESILFGDTLRIVPYLANYGHAGADSVYGRVSAFSETLVVVDSVVTFPEIDPHEVVSSEPDAFKVFCVYPGSEVRLNLRIYHNGLEIINREIKLGDVARVDSLRVQGSTGSIFLEWSSVLGVVGYRVYRALTYGGPYTFLGNRLANISHYEDCPVEPGVDYHYYVEAVDSSMNQGGSSDTLCGRTNPRYAQGWPQPVYAFLHSSPNFADIDPTYSGLEIIVGAHDGCIYAWHYDGTPVNGSDSRLFDSGSDYIWSSPAIGDVNGDGSLEIVFGAMTSTDNLYVIGYDPTNHEVSILPGWPKSLTGGGLVSSPLLADIDKDGDLEIFALSFSPATLYAFHHDGSGVYEPESGLLESLYGCAWGTPAIGDINRDGDLEIVCYNEAGQLFVWDRYGEYLPPFPVAIDSGQAYSTIVGDIVGDSNLEICFYTGDPSHKINLVAHNGTILWQHTVKANFIELCPAFGDVNNDGCAEVIFGYNDGLDQGLVIFDSIGNVLSGFPKRGHDAYPPIVIDANGDDNFDVITGSTEWNIYGYNGNSINVPGFPIKLGNRINSSPAAYDIDLDGELELLVSCYDLKLHVFDLDARLADWPRFHYDPHNSGCYKSGYYTGIKDIKMNDMSSFGLTVYPNPFTHAAHIRYGLPNTDQKISLKIYDILGRLVKDFDMQSDITNRTSPLIWYGDDNRGRKVSSGIYFVKIEDDENRTFQKVVKIQ